MKETAVAEKVEPCELSKPTRKTVFKHVFDSPYGKFSLQPVSDDLQFRLLEHLRARCLQPKGKGFASAKSRLPEIVCGINEVFRSLERHQLRLVFVSKDAPSVLVQHVSRIAVTHGICACAISTKDIASLLGLHSLTCFGLKTPSEEEPDSWTDLHSYVLNDSSVFTALPRRLAQVSTASAHLKRKRIDEQ